MSEELETSTGPTPETPAEGAAPETAPTATPIPDQDEPESPAE
jgi:hypothetical protein